MEEVAKTLSPVAGIDLNQYKDTLIKRFSNVHIGDAILRILYLTQHFHFAIIQNVMGRFEKLIQKVLSGRQDANITFSEAVSLLQNLRFSLRINGSHHVFYRNGVDEIINIQPDGSKAKPYQVKQIRDLIVKYRLEESDG
ncbi:hypothetical protein AGMMS50293_14830 [Spirochaetia bacterium]|nr:hypothetical protein AGMMS50293_14830 [Spirochaetia bacterium]